MENPVLLVKNYLKIMNELRSDINVSESICDIDATINAEPESTVSANVSTNE